jgi:hypothetical protein
MAAQKNPFGQSDARTTMGFTHSVNMAAALRRTSGSQLLPESRPNWTSVCYGWNAKRLEGIRQVGCRGVDLFPSRSLTVCNLLIPRWSGMPRKATKAIPSFSFHSVLGVVGLL